MNNWQPDKFKEKYAYLQMRMKMVRALRMFFDTQNFDAVETPALQRCPTIDTHIHGISAPLRRADLSLRGKMYLHTSPEFAMKKLLVAGLSNIYQICQVFRDGEDGAYHSPEFTLLEWYRMAADYRDIMDDCVELLRYVASALGLSEFQHKEHRCDPFKPWVFLTVHEAFRTYAHIEIPEDIDDFKAAALQEGIRVVDTDSWEDVFHAIMAEKIEPFLGLSVPVILYDYPVRLASLSRTRGTVAERFELYVCGLELANAFSELTDLQEQRKRAEEDLSMKKALYQEDYPLDEDFFQALSYGLDACSGIALGVDRLAMLCCGVDRISDVLWLPVDCPD